MSIDPTDVALAFLTPLVAALLIAVFAVGLTALRSPGQLAVLIAALLVVAAAVVEPFARFGDDVAR